MHLGFYLLLSPLLVCAQTPPHQALYSTYNYYVLEHVPSVHAPLFDSARALGVEVVQQVGELRNHWLVRAPKPPMNVQDQVMSNYHSIKSQALSSEHLGTRSAQAIRSRHIASAVPGLLPQTPRRRIKRDSYLPAWTPQPVSARATSLALALASRLGIADPIFPDQWHFINEDFPEHMMNVTPVWEQLGITGHGVYVAMVDDGIDYEHDDLKRNFVRHERTMPCSEPYGSCVSLLRVRTISMIMKHSQRPSCPMTHTAPAVLARSPPSRTTPVVLVSPIMPRLPVCASCPESFQTLTRPTPSTTPTRTRPSIAVAGDPPTTAAPWKPPPLLSKKRS